VAWTSTPTWARASASTATGPTTNCCPFADRGYHADGSVKMFDWTLEEAGGTPEAIARRVVEVLRCGRVPALGGGEAPVVAETVCVHSDTPDSPLIARAIRQALATAGIEVCPR
jgi:UPF0271 protein